MEQVMIHPLNFYGILMESLSIIFSWKKIFTQITVATIFPLSLLSLCHELLLSNTLHNVTRWAFSAAYVVVFLALSLVSTSAVVDAVARVYTAGEARFAEVMGAVARVWKRVLVTFGWSLMAVVAYNINMAALSLLFPLPWFISGVYVIGFVYISIIWHLASVVSVLEEDCVCGVEAMVKSMALVKGRMAITAAAVFLLLNLSFLSIQVVFRNGNGNGELLFWRRIGCFLLLSGFTLLGLVTQTVVYFVCKLYHCPNYSYLPNHHKLHLGDYAPLRSNELDHC